jgi:hypothetical protein
LSPFLSLIFRLWVWLSFFFLSHCTVSSRGGEGEYFPRPLVFFLNLRKLWSSPPLLIVGIGVCRTDYSGRGELSARQMHLAQFLRYCYPNWHPQRSGSRSEKGNFFLLLNRTLRRKKREWIHTFAKDYRFFSVSKMCEQIGNFPESRPKRNSGSGINLSRSGINLPGSKTLHR